MIFGATYGYIVGSKFGSLFIRNLHWNMQLKVYHYFIQALLFAGIPLIKFHMYTRSQYSRRPATSELQTARKQTPSNLHKASPICRWKNQNLKDQRYHHKANIKKHQKTSITLSFSAFFASLLYHFVCRSAFTSSGRRLRGRGIAHELATRTTGGADQSCNVSGALEAQAAWGFGRRLI